MKLLSKAVAIVCSLLFLATPVFAATEVTTTGLTFEICNVETNSGVCENGAGDSFIRMNRFSKFSVFFTEVGSGSVCDIFVEDQEFMGAVPASLDTHGKQLNSVELSAVVPLLAYELPVYGLWLKCTINGTNVSVNVQVEEKPND